MSHLIRHPEIDGAPHPSVSSEVWDSLSEDMKKSLSFNVNRDFAHKEVENLFQAGKDITSLARKLNTHSNFLRENALRIFSENVGEKDPAVMEQNRLNFVAMLQQINSDIEVLKQNTRLLTEAVKMEYNNGNI